MVVLSYVLLGFAPGLFWLWLLYQRDKYIPAPPHLVVRTFLWGIAVAVPVVIVEVILVKVAGFVFDKEPKSNIVQIAYASFVVAGMTEEFAKYLVVKRTVYESPYLRQPLDGIIFCAAAALGFASIENVGYMVSFGPAVILARGPFSTLAHVLFSVVLGYTLGMVKQGKVGPYLIAVALIAAMVLHGLFNFLLLSGPSYWAWALVLFFGMGVVFLLLLRLARRQSPFRNKVAAVTVVCPACMKESGFGASFCTGCGNSLAAARSSSVFLCGNCNGSVGKRHQFCTSCGSRLERKLASARG